MVIIFVAFAATQTAFRARNWWQYGSFSGVDVKEANFQKALGALGSVRSGGIKPFIPVSRATRQHIYRASPAFASLKFYFDPPDEPTPSASVGGWIGYTCQLTPQACGEIGAGWFLWALRDAAAKSGHYVSPARASVFFGQMANEINTACARGELECRPQLISELPPVIWSDVAAEMIARIPRLLKLITVEYSAVKIYDSAGSEELLDAAARFLNHPRYKPPKEQLARSMYSINGWFYRSGAQWFSVSAKIGDGASEPIPVIRKDSADLPALLNDPLATRQRFTLAFHCTDDCLLVFDIGDGVRLEKQISELRRGLVGVKSGNASLILESTSEFSNPAAIETRAERTANRIRVAVATNYHFLYLPVLALGGAAFLAVTMLYWRVMAFSLCYVLAFVFWTLAITRALLLTLIDATSFPGLHMSYLSPVYFLVIAASVMSLAALADAALLRGRGRA